MNLFFRLGILLTVFLFVVAGRQSSQAQSADDFGISWGVTDNYVGGPAYFTSRMTISNLGEGTLGDNWKIYFNFIRRIQTDSLLAPVAIRFINGSFYEMTPSPGFSLEPGRSLPIRIVASNWAIRESAAPYGFYIIFDDGSPESIENVTVEPFTEPRQMDRYEGDVMPVATAEWTFRRNERLTLLEKDDFSPVTPTPSTTVRKDGHYPLSHVVLVGVTGTAQTEAFSLNEWFDGTDVDIRFADAVEPDADVVLAIADSAEGIPNCAHAGAYLLSVDQHDGIRIVAREPSGIFYGLQSFLGLIEANDAGLTVPAVEIGDCPRFPYRGLMIDVARYFHPAERIKQTIRVMSFYKLNTLHFHLSDDEGWRLPVAALPELTEVGGRRGHTLDSREMLPPAFGSGPDAETSNGSGFYTREEFIDILRYATKHHVEVIPEIDSPGHMRAAIKSMENRYQWLLSAGKPEDAGRFLLTDFDDPSEYRSVQGWNDNVANVCLPSTFRFMETVIDELVALFAEAGAPLTMVHLGGDEVPPGVWEKSPACDRVLASRDDLHDVHDLSADFYQRIVKYLESKGLKGAGWEEIGLRAEEVDGVRREVPKPDLAGKVIPYAWNSVWGWGGEDRGYKLANAGYQVVMANAPNLYFDLAAEKHPKEPGFAWGGFVDERKIFEMTPMDVYNSAYEDRLGHPIDLDRYLDADRLTPEGAKNILGIQGQLWGENTPSKERFEYHLYPKLLALAERAWVAQPEWETIEDKGKRLALLDEDWNRFANSLGQRELPRLATQFGIEDYRVPPPGAVIVDGVLRTNATFPGLVVHPKLNGSDVTVRAFDSAGHSSRDVVISH